MVMAQIYIDGNSLCYRDDKINFTEGVGLRDEVIVDFADESTIRFQNKARIVPPYTREWKVDVVVPPCDAAANYGKRILDFLLKLMYNYKKERR